MVEFFSTRCRTSDKNKIDQVSDLTVFFDQQSYSTSCHVRRKGFRREVVHREKWGVENYNDVDNLQRKENVNRHRSIKMQFTKKYPSFVKESEILYHLHKCQYGSFNFLMIINFIPDFNYINFNQSDSSINRVIFVYFDRWWETGTHTWFIQILFVQFYLILI